MFDSRAKLCLFGGRAGARVGPDGTSFSVTYYGELTPGPHGYGRTHEEAIAASFRQTLDDPQNGRYIRAEVAR